MAIAYPSPLLVAGARAVLEHMWVVNNGKLPKTLDQIYAACRAYTEPERAAIVIAIQDYFPDDADKFCLPLIPDQPEVS